MPIRKWTLFSLTVLAVFVIDQISKAWVLANLRLYQTQTIHPALLPVLQFTRTENTGVAFGVGQGNSFVFLLLSTAIIIFLLVLIWRSEPQDSLQHIGLGLVVGGAIGNVVDRIQHGYVVDFVHVVIPNLFNSEARAWVSNVSNFADHFIILGVVFLLIDTYIQDRREKLALKANADATTEEALSVGVDADA